MAKIHTVRKQKPNIEEQKYDAFSLGITVGKLCDRLPAYTSDLKRVWYHNHSKKLIGDILTKTTEVYNSSRAILEQTKQFKDHPRVQELQSKLDEFGRVQHDRCEDFAYHYKLQFKDKYD